MYLFRSNYIIVTNNQLLISFMKTEYFRFCKNAQIILAIEYNKYTGKIETTEIY